MCGRIVQKNPPDSLALAVIEGWDEEDLPRGHGNVPPRFNGAPSQDHWVVRRDAGSGRLSMDLLRWGLVPGSAAQPPKPPPINARSETVATSRLFRAAFGSRRCIVPVDAFYEWQGAGTPARRPFAIARPDRQPFGLAGLWENRRDPETGSWRRTFCVLTTRSNAVLADVHDRMPVLIPREDAGRWLGDEDDPRDLLRAAPDETLETWPVSSRVNSFRNDDPSLLDAVAAA